MFLSYVRLRELFRSSSIRKSLTYTAARTGVRYGLLFCILALGPLGVFILWRWTADFIQVVSQIRPYDGFWQWVWGTIGDLVLLMCAPLLCFAALGAASGLVAGGLFRAMTAYQCCCWSSIHRNTTHDK